MSLQKYRADEAVVQPDGATCWYARWMGGPTLAKVQACRVANSYISRRTVYVTGEADTWFSVPAACTYKRRTVRGYLTSDDNGNTVFRVHSDDPTYCTECSICRQHHGKEVTHACE